MVVRTFSLYLLFMYVCTLHLTIDLIANDLIRLQGA